MTHIDVTSHGAVGNGVTDSTAAVQLAFDQAAKTGAGVYFPPGTYLLTAGPTILEPHFNDLSASYNSCVAVQVRSGVGEIRGPGAMVRLIANANVLPDICFLFGNHSDDALDSVSWHGLSFDLDAQGNRRRTAQARGILAVGASRLEMHGCRFTSISKRGGYAINLHACDNVALEGCRFENLSGGVHSIYSTNLRLTACTFERFSEGIDLDKVNQDVTINDCTFREGLSDRDEVIDSNASIDLTVSNCRFEDCKKVLTFNSKGNIAANWTDHLNTTNRGWQVGRELSFVGNTLESCAKSNNLTAISLGDDWSDERPRPEGTHPVRRLVLEDNLLQDTGFVYVLEATELEIRNNHFERIWVKTSESIWSALTLLSEHNWLVWPLAETGSDLQAKIEGNQFNVVGRGAIFVRGASAVEICDNVITDSHRQTQNEDGEPVDYPAAISIYHLQSRDTQGKVTGNQIANGWRNSSALAFQTRSAISNARLTVLDNHVEGHVVEVALFGDGIGDMLEGEVEVVPVPAPAAGSTSANWAAPSALTLVSAWVSSDLAVAPSDTDYLALSLVKETLAGSQIDIVNATTQSDGLELGPAPASLGIPVLYTPDTRLVAGDQVWLVVHRIGAPVGVSDLELKLTFITH